MNSSFEFQIPKPCMHFIRNHLNFRKCLKCFATGFMVGFIEWACLLAIKPHLDWPEEQTVGTHINVDHLAATPPSLKVCAKVKLIEVNGRRLVFDVEVHDGIDTISRGKHERFLINAKKFNQKMKDKLKKSAGI